MRFSDDEIKAAVAASSSWAEVCRSLHAGDATGSQWHMKHRAVSLSLDFSHFTGRAWNKGLTLEKRPITDFLVLDGPFITSHKLKLRLIDEGLKPAHCEECESSQWLGEELPLELDHVDGNRRDNRLENLKILCPNCHAVKTRKCRSGGIGIRA